MMGGYGGQFLAGILLTLEISVCSYLIGLIFGVLGAAAKLAPWRVLRVLGNLYTIIVRALPELLLLLIAFYVLAGALSGLAASVGLVKSDFSFSPFLVAVIALGFIQGAYVTEILRAGVLALPRGQSDAALALGLSFPVRWGRVLGPQVLRHALPALGNVWLNATKDSSLISIVGAFADVLKVSSLAAAATKQYILFYALAALCFLLISVVSMWILNALHIRSRRGLHIA
ncbi:ABC transporter permease subunit [Acidisoma silvae]|uniref:ABC transporter permease subunit n=1 Tax=Acidisoma silvae TaxID=2802396 RepID=A0A963YTX7_9PROT|nr:ABC transporter permease subunit [Acidisoma silvae]MCB8876477.1 ABC transporter permease subunit [Acidisoma silvae]